VVRRLFGFQKKKKGRDTVPSTAWESLQKTVAPRRNAATFVEYDKLLPVIGCLGKVCLGFGSF